MLAPPMPEPEPRPDKIVILAKVLFEHGPICAPCISAKSGLTVDDIEPTVSRFEETLSVKREIGRCLACERWTLVYSMFGKPQK
jgi:hypothetical protein